MAKISKKKSITIKGVLDISKEDNQIYVVIEDGETMALADLLQDFEMCEVAMSVAETVDIA